MSEDCLTCSDLQQKSLSSLLRGCSEVIWTPSWSPVFSKVHQTKPNLRWSGQMRHWGRFVREASSTLAAAAIWWEIRGVSCWWSKENQESGKSSISSDSSADRRCTRLRWRACLQGSSSFWSRISSNISCSKELETPLSQSTQVIGNQLLSSMNRDLDTSTSW